MTVLPGSLDYLYYQGILDHIPYEAYDMPYIGVQEMQTPMPSGSQLKQMAIESVGAGGANGVGGVNGMNGIDSTANAQLNSRTGIRRQRNNNFNSTNTSSMNASQYLDAARSGMIYDAYGSGDSFVRNNNLNYNAAAANNSAAGGASGYGSVYDLKAQTLGLKNSDGKKSSKDPVFGSSSWKGILAAGLVILTPILLIKGFKKKP